MNSKDDGIWYPDSLEPYMGWKGGSFELDQYLSGSLFNPFEINNQL